MQQREDINNDDKTKFKKIPSLYWKRGKRPMNMSGWRWYKVSIGFWRPEGENSIKMKFEKRGKYLLNIQVIKTHSSQLCQNINTWDVQSSLHRLHFSFCCLLNIFICEFTGFTAKLISLITKWKMSVEFTEPLYTFFQRYAKDNIYLSLWQLLKTDPALLSAWGPEWGSSGSPLKKMPEAPWWSLPD